MKPKVLIGISGGIAAYKVCEVISALAKKEVEVRAILTEAAMEFITPLTVATLCRHQAYTDADFWEYHNGKPLHILLGEWAEIFLIAPLTANTLAKLAYGLADNLLTNTVLASRCPILLAPAMNTDMWEQATVQRNWQEIISNNNTRYYNIEPGAGMLACDRIGFGRMAEPSAILAYIESILHTKGKKDLVGKKVLISAGGTKEYLDPVRFIGNPATGKMGIALATAAYHRGASVTLVHSQDSLANNVLAIGENVNSIKCISVVSSEEMRQAMLDNFAEAEMIIMAAAVGDVKPKFYSQDKVPKKDLPESLALESVPDILAELGGLKKKDQKLIGFAAQTGDIIKPALEKLRRKNLDAIVANPVDQIGAGFGSDTNQAILIDGQGNQHTIPLCSKLLMAHQIWDLISIN